MDTSATSSNMDGIDSTPKRRRENFSDKENIIVLDGVMANAQKLFVRGACDAAGKTEIWQQIVQKVNEEGKKDRTGTECRKRLPEYKRKIKNIIKKARESGNSNWEDILTSRQFQVATYFNMLSDTENEAQDSCDEKSFDEETPTTSHNELPLSICPSAESENNLISVTQTGSMRSGSADDALDPSVSQYSEQTSSVQSDSMGQISAELATSAEGPLNEQLMQVGIPDGKIDQLITIQTENKTILQSIKDSLSTTQQLHVKMYRLQKINRKKMRKLIKRIHEDLNNQEIIMDIKLNSLRTILQDSITSDDSDDDHCLDQQASI